MNTSPNCWPYRWVLLWLLSAALSVQAQPDTADRLWQGAEQQSRQQPAPMPVEESGAGSLLDSALATLTQTPHIRLQQLTLAVLEAVNRRDWFGADRLLRQYALVPQHDPALFAFVDASRLAAQGDYGAAIARYREALRTNPQFTRGQLDLARVLYADNQLRDAREAFEQLRARPLPPEIQGHIHDYLQALAQRSRLRISMTVSASLEDNVNNVSTIVDPCALLFYGICLENEAGKEIGATGLYAEATFDKLWPLAGRHALMLRSINYGNSYRHAHAYDNLASTTYLGYQYSSGGNQLQLLPLFEFNREGGQKIYHAWGLRAGIQRQLSPGVQLEASYEYKARQFARGLENLQGDTQSLMLFGSYALRSDLLLYSSLSWRFSDAHLPIFIYREKQARLGMYKSFAGQVTANVSYAYRHKHAEEANRVFGKRQRDREGSIYINLALPGHQWQGLTPSLTYEYRHNRSTIAHSYSYEKNRVTLGFNKLF